MMRGAYQTDLSNEEWKLIEPHLPAPKKHGRPRVYTLRETLDTVFYIVRSGCAWRLLPHDFPPWKTVYHYFRLWCIDGTWEQLNAAIRQRLRGRLGCDPQPTQRGYCRFPVSARVKRDDENAAASTSRPTTKQRSRRLPGPPRPLSRLSSTPSAPSRRQLLSWIPAPRSSYPNLLLPGLVRGPASCCL